MSKYIVATALLLLVGGGLFIYQSSNSSNTGAFKNESASTNQSVSTTTNIACTKKANSYLSTGQQFFDIAYPLNFELRSAQTDKLGTCYAIVEWTDYNREWKDDYHTFEFINVDNGQTVLLTEWMRRCDYLPSTFCGQMSKKYPYNTDLEPSLQKISYLNFTSKVSAILSK